MSELIIVGLAVAVGFATAGVVAHNWPDGFARVVDFVASVVRRIVPRK